MIYKNNRAQVTQEPMKFKETLVPKISNATLNTWTNFFVTSEVVIKQNDNDSITNYHS